MTTGSGSTELIEPGVPFGIQLDCQLVAKLLSKLGSVSSKEAPPPSWLVPQSP